MKIGVIDVGGGSRDIFGAGVLDYCLDENIQFDYCIGISAGSANLASYLAGQRGRNYVFYTNYFFRKDYASMRNVLTKRKYLDLDYVYGTLSDQGGEYPLDYDQMLKNPATFFVETCNGVNANSIFIEKSNFNAYRMDVFKASSCLPIVCPPTKMDGIPCFDGGLANPVPIQKALDDGCDKIVLILTKPKDTPILSDKDVRRALLLKRRYPSVAKALENRADTYNREINLAKKLEAEGKVLILAPKNIDGLKTLTQDKEKLENLYQEGMKEGKRIKAFLMNE